MAQDTWINSFYADLGYTGWQDVVFVNKIKHEVHAQRRDDPLYHQGAHFTPDASLRLGVEYTSFHNLRSAAAVRASTQQVDDFQGLVIAGELTNSVDYVGYRLASRIGFRQETRYFTGLTRTGNVVFVQIFAGLGT